LNFKTVAMGTPTQQYEVSLGGGVKLEMVVIPLGSFTMGSAAGESERVANEGPQRTVNVNKFVMGKYEVTQAQWRAVMGTNPSSFKGDSLPVEQVSWDDAKEFCRRLNLLLGLSGSTGYRLPTEAEWEYAARAGTTTPFAFGETIYAGIVNYSGAYPYGTGPVGIYRATTVDVGSLGMANGSGMCGSGARTTTTIVIVGRQSTGVRGWTHNGLRTVSSAAAAGTPTPSTAARRVATRSRRPSAAASSASACRGLYPRHFYPSFCRN
jgi:formylglycine-generating enzyme required for sulfatase activity